MQGTGLDIDGKKIILPVVLSFCLFDMKKIYSFLIAVVICALTFGMVIYFNRPVVIAPETPEMFEPNAILSENEINWLLEEYAYCEADEDCTRFYATCPFGCGKGINVAFLDTAQATINTFRQHQLETNGVMCEYWCVEVQGVSCQDHKCVIQAESFDKEISAEG